MTFAYNQGNFANLLAGFTKGIVTRGTKFTPALKRYRKDTPNMATKEVWNQLVLIDMTDQLTEAVADATVDEITIRGNTPNTPIQYFPGVTDILVDDEYMTVLQVISSTKLKVLRGVRGTTAEAHSDNTIIYVFPNNEMGSDILGRNDIQISGQVFNYPSNFQTEIVVAKLNLQDRQPKYTTLNEADFKVQKRRMENWIRQVIETEFFYGVRSTQGSGPTTQSDLPMTTKTGKSSTMGLKQAISLNGGLTFDFSSSALSESKLYDVVRQGRNLGFYNNTDDMEVDEADAIMYVALDQHEVVQDLVKSSRIITEAVPTKIGTNVNLFNLGGIKVSIEPSKGVKAQDAFIVPNQALDAAEPMFEINLQRFAEVQEKIDRGDRVTQPYETTYMNKLPGGFASIYLTNLALPVSLTPES